MVAEVQDILALPVAHAAHAAHAVHVVRAAAAEAEALINSIWNRK